MNWALFKNSLFVASLATLLAVVFGLASALCAKGLVPRTQRLLLIMAIVALALPPFLVTNCWLHFLGLTGAWRSWLPFNIFTLGGAVWILALMLWPITFLASWSVWQRLEPEHLESDLAVTGWTLIRGLLWPLGRGAIGQAALLTFVLALNNFAVPAILQVKVFPAEMWVRFTTNFDTAAAALLSLPLVVGPLLLLIGLSRREVPWPHRGAPVPSKLFREQLGPGWFSLCGFVALSLCLLSVALPAAQLATIKRTWTELPGAVAAGQRAIWNSALFATISATLVIAISLAWHGRLVAQVSNLLFRRFPTCSPTDQANLAGARKPGRLEVGDTAGWKPAQRISALLWLPFLAPGVLLGIALIWLFNRPWTAFLYQSAGIVILAFLIRYLAPGWFMISHAAGKCDTNLIDTARMDGANTFQTFRHAILPQIASQTAAACYVIFLLCLWDVETMILIWPPGYETLALRIFNLLHYGHNAQVNALCVTLLALALAPLAMWGAWEVLSRAWRPASRITLHASRFTILTALALTFLSGCSPSSTSSVTSISSTIFRGVQVIGTRGVGAGELNKPRSVAVDAQDNVCAVDMTGRVQKFSPDGKYVLLWQMPQTDLGKPKGMCRDRDGNIIVVEPHYQRLNWFTPDGTLLGQWGTKGTNEGQFMMPRAAAVNSRREIYVSEYGAVERVQRFTIYNLQFTNTSVVASTNATMLSKPDSHIGLRFLNSFGHPGTGPGEFNRPEGLCVDAHDNVYVADSCNHRIQVFNAEGKFLRAYGKAGTGLGELSYPYDIAVDAAGRQYVCEFGNSRIQVFDANDQPIEIIGKAGTDPGQFGDPWGVALDSSGNLYVADSQNHRVQKLLRMN